MKAIMIAALFLSLPASAADCPMDISSDLQSKINLCKTQVSVTRDVWQTTPGYEWCPDIMRQYNEIHRKAILCGRAKDADK